jgi:hypothetical protein
MTQKLTDVMANIKAASVGLWGQHGREQSDQCGD